MSDPLEGRTVLVTGATDGLGRELSRRLAARGAGVLLHGRDQDKARNVAATIREATGSERLRTYLADLSSLAEARRLADEVRGTQDRLDALVNNAGIIAGERRQQSEDGHELTFAVNYLAGFLLTTMLLPLLRDSAPARIVNVSSGAQRAIDFDDVMLVRGYDPMRAYSRSKLAQAMFTLELAERLPAGVTANCLHPASLMDTNMVREAVGRPMTSVEEGAEATLRLVASPELEGVSGRYFDGTRESRAGQQAYDREARARLWALSEELTGASLRAGA